jgi:two-component system, chemotaxis family, chemotaxis protein CheY
MKTVLIVEDDTPLCWLLERIFRGKYNVVLMNNGMEAWSWLSDGNHCDLIISDVNMPSLTGIELLENLQHSGIYNAIPVIILSGLDDLKNQCMERGAFSYLVKPFEPQQLLAEAKSALTRKSESLLV